MRQLLHPISHAGSLRIKGMATTRYLDVLYLFSSKSNMSRIFPAVAILAVTGCNAPKATPPDYTAINEVETLKEQFEMLAKRVDDLETKDMSSAYLPATSKDFQTLDAGAVRLVVALESVGQLASGSQALVRIGNPSSATVTALAYTVAWGPTNAKGFAVTESRRSEKRTLNQRLSPGEWAVVQIPLPDIPPKQVGYISISDASVTGISLLR